MWAAGLKPTLHSVQLVAMVTPAVATHHPEFLSRAWKDFTVVLLHAP